MRREDPRCSHDRSAPDQGARALQGARVLQIAAVLACVLSVAGCEVGRPPLNGAGAAPGQVGRTFKVDVFKPMNGTVTSADGQIQCGTAGAACSAEFGWLTTVVLTATPDAGFGLQSWAGDCSQVGECYLDTSQYGADKYVVAVFNPLDELGHGNWTSPDLHAPGYRDFVAQVPGARQCTSCHGGALEGQGIAVSCDACHATNGLGHWKSGGSCTACHGDATRVAVAGADPLVNAAPPVDTRGGLTRGTRGVGAHEAHLNGSARPVACAECHAVPSSTSHADGVVDVAFGTLARTGGASPTWNGASCSASYCHGATLAGGSNTVPVWISGASQATCGSCHGLPPPAPHTTNTDCGACHAGYTAATVDPAKHVDGIVQVASPGGGAPTCGSCHGIPPAAPHTASTTCGDCHSGYSATTVNATLHQNGTKDVIALSCTSCHGAPPATGEHRRSVHVNRSCGDCHPGYTTTSANATLHQNGAKDVGNRITSYNPSTRNCLSTCHGSKTW